VHGPYSLTTGNCKAIATEIERNSGVLVHRPWLSCGFFSMTNTPFDQSRRFLFEDADIRGETVHLDSAYGEILAIHQYASGVARLLGEFLAAAVLLSTNLKFEGKLVLQARSEGQIPLLMV
jgi:hypothetical protein